MSKFTVLKTRLKKFTPSVVGVGLVTLAGTAKATVATDISTAVSDATGNIGLVASGLITIAAVMLGIGLIVRALAK